jgi:hypothetical protein
MLWMLRPQKRIQQAFDQGAAQGWSSCLEAVEKFLGEHQWAVEDDNPSEILCDGCGASLSRQLKTMRKGNAVPPKGGRQ